eukprot:CAMPEP_0194070316 /NCGR_PEP_ID=MMETSP0009_2-20130614/88117_1 /TAXON_ID=210454 /ORGANISM="Grammatophora oceanica, Strain CCMP 410" /LENGTH=66 /DNA_ID=CAMNT_0038723581 /DNA_START=338 /DNA_END=535 /DNA_ORIENTATION=+
MDYRAKPLNTDMEASSESTEGRKVGQIRETGFNKRARQAINERPSRRQVQNRTYGDNQTTNLRTMW